MDTSQNQAKQSTVKPQRTNLIRSEGEFIKVKILRYEFLP